MLQQDKVIKVTQNCCSSLENILKAQLFPGSPDTGTILELLLLEFLLRWDVRTRCYHSDAPWTSRELNSAHPMHMSVNATVAKLD